MTGAGFRESRLQYQVESLLTALVLVEEELLDLSLG